MRVTVRVRPGGRNNLEEARRLRAEREAARIAAMHVSEAERHWAQLSPHAQATAVQRGFAASLPDADRRRITRKKALS